MVGTIQDLQTSNPCPHWKQRPEGGKGDKAMAAEARSLEMLEYEPPLGLSSLRSR